MIRTIVIPKNTDLHVSIPEEYIGKQIEILVYKTDEINSNRYKTEETRSLRGKLNLTAVEQEDLQRHLTEIRNEWNKDI
jgi:hypothetical protein